MAARRALEWIGTSKGRLVFRYEISDLFLFIPFTEYISLNFPYRVRRLWFRIETVVLPPQEDLSMAVVNLCNTFKAQYLEVCKEDIVSDKRWERAHCLLLGLYPHHRAVYGIKGEDMPTYANQTHAIRVRCTHTLIILSWTGTVEWTREWTFKKCLKKSFHSQIWFLGSTSTPSQLWLELACVQAFSSIPISEACPGPRCCFIAVFCQLSLTLGQSDLPYWPQVSLVGSLWATHAFWYISSWFSQ